MKHPKRRKPTKAERKRHKVKPPRHPMAAEAQALARNVVRTIMQPLSVPEVAKPIQPTDQAPTYTVTKGLVVDPSAMWPIRLFGGQPRSWFVNNGTIYADDTIVLDTPETKPLSNP